MLACLQDTIFVVVGASVSNNPDVQTAFHAFLNTASSSSPHCGLDLKNVTMRKGALAVAVLGED